MGKRIKVALTGAAGQIGYATVFRLISGEVFGYDTKVDLNLVEVPVPEILENLKGLVMELEDCAFNTLGDVNIFDNPKDGFKDANVVLLIGAKPRSPGMERADLLKENGKIFVSQGQALNGAASDVMVFVVGNPANTNALIAHSNSDLSCKRFAAMTMLDQNRARNQIARKLDVSIKHVRNLVIFGNHSPTMVPDFENAFVLNQHLTDIIKDRNYLENEFTPAVQQRGSSVIKARGGKSSAASAGNACIDMVKNYFSPTCLSDNFSAGIKTKADNPYGIKEGIVYSFPLKSDGFGRVRIDPTFKISSYLRAALDKSAEELFKEKEAVKDFLKR